MVGGAIHSRVGMSVLPDKNFAGGAEMADVGHARADEDLVDLLAGDFRQRLDVVRVVRAGQQRLLDLGEVDFEHGGIFGVGIGLQQGRIGDPGFLAAMRRSSERAS